MPPDRKLSDDIHLTVKLEAQSAPGGVIDALIDAFKAAGLLVEPDDGFMDHALPADKIAEALVGVATEFCAKRRGGRGASDAKTWAKRWVDPVLEDRDGKGAVRGELNRMSPDRVAEIQRDFKATGAFESLGSVLKPAGRSL